MIFLVHYDRKQGKLVSMAAYTDRDRLEASKAKMELEISLLGSTGVNEVVLLEAATEDDLKGSHSRYFKTLEQLKSSDGKG